VQAAPEARHDAAAAGLGTRIVEIAGIRAAINAPFPIRLMTSRRFGGGTEVSGAPVPEDSSIKPASANSTKANLTKSDEKA